MRGSIDICFGSVNCFNKSFIVCLLEFFNTFDSNWPSGFDSDIMFCLSPSGNYSGGFVYFDVGERGSYSITYSCLFKLFAS